MIEVCSNCGSKEIGQGSLDAQACLRPSNTGKHFGQFSRVIADVCTECGTILSMKVKYPEYFKTNR
ncbi:hypothetical protein QUF88_17720 [Bacillus sp. DX1.1]|uniref:hypothetical protein n=1 Tax=unclassified Bacillus (in: firmicutes) TaxID=185979 RepID=UPI00256FE4EF|nr:MULTISPECIES: hypothetical protein [unclassified Bacillus (in: firmicutes)]MDM5155563.1 hypothetical protein [Bacillus sp. DX1.1]WJE79871.1 hypothetical protein QRE67_15245 [Bacillus sp. DX3.1]